MFVYEKAFKEPIRICLRLEALHKVLLSCNRDHFSISDAKSCLQALISLIEILDRSDLRSKLAIELSICHKKLLKYQTQEGVDLKSLQSAIALCEGIQEQQYKSSGLLSKVLLDDPFLAKIYHAQNSLDDTFYIQSWELQDMALLKEQVQHWMYALEHLWKVVGLILMMVRSFHNMTSAQAPSGFYRENMVGQDINPVQLVRVECESILYPSISLAWKGISITFYQSTWQNGLFSSERHEEDIPFSLAICST